MGLQTVLTRLRLDPYILAIVGMVVLASIIPAHGQGAVWLGWMTHFAIALLFFLYGGRLSRESIVAGITHWRLQLLVLIVTFVLFPLIGVVIGLLAKPFLTPELTLGLVFLCLLPSTVQSSVAFTSIARGNVPAAVCCATLSNLLGIFITPVLVGVVLHTQGQAFSAQAVLDIALQLFAPFIAGQLCRRWLANWLERKRSMLSYVDRGSILLVVYAAFSEGVVNGLWQKLALDKLFILLLLCCLLLALAIVLTTWLSRRFGFNDADEIAIVFCGSKKSLASGVPMANVLFAGASVGLMVLPLMLFHQIQLMVCAVLARRFAERKQQT